MRQDLPSFPLFLDAGTAAPATEPLRAQPAWTNRPGAPLAGWVVTNSIPATNEITCELFERDRRREPRLCRPALQRGYREGGNRHRPRKFPNPTLNLNGAKERAQTWNRNLPGENGRLVSQAMPEPMGVGLDQTIEYFGKRKVARSRGGPRTPAPPRRPSMTFSASLKLDASAAFVDALATQRAARTGTAGGRAISANWLWRSGAVSARATSARTDLTQSRVDELQSPE